MRFRRAFPTVCLLLALGASADLAAKGPPPTKLDLPPPLQLARTIAAEDLLTSAQKLLPKGAFLGPLLDARYAVIKHDWLVRRFVPFYRDAVAALREAADGGGAEGADCDDFGMFLRHMAGLSGMLAGSAAGVGAGLAAQEEAHVFIPWDQVRSLSIREGSHYIAVRGEFGTKPIGLYCTPENYRVVVQILQERTGKVA